MYLHTFGVLLTLLTSALALSSPCSQPSGRLSYSAFADVYNLVGTTFFSNSLSTDTSGAIDTIVLRLNTTAFPPGLYCVEFCYLGITTQPFVGLMRSGWSASTADLFPSFTVSPTPMVILPPVAPSILPSTTVALSSSTQATNGNCQSASLYFPGSVTTYYTGQLRTTVAPTYTQQWATLNMYHMY
jgi:hypothetical protein